ncbi:hypothetical protein [Achromobacter phage Motura]|uniref:Uncharacterized protein n=1 Tax=Achromobacter phage Motura TaxID=2591403 RepID=A0A514CT42_9CAUD|nr:hypothetical protein H1O15_gp143 [Achromobacter phage Motura]QDH83645.1 hypothetical protein [Achromobacter phage Motura]
MENQTNEGSFGFERKDLPASVKLGAQPLRAEQTVQPGQDITSGDSPHNIHAQLLAEAPASAPRNLVDEFPQFKPVHLRKPLATPVTPVENLGLSNAATAAMERMAPGMTAMLEQGITGGVPPAPHVESVATVREPVATAQITGHQSPIPQQQAASIPPQGQVFIPQLTTDPVVQAPGIVQRPNLGYIDVPAHAASEAVPVNLPSRFGLYGFQDLYVYPLKGKHLAKFARAHAESSLRLTVEAVSAACVTTNQAFRGVSLAHMLSVQDFYYLMYFMRKANFPKTELKHTAYCSNRDHLLQVAKGELPEESLKIMETVQHTQLIVTELERVPEYSKQIMGAVALRPATMMDTIEWAEDPRFQDEDVKWLGHCASYIAAPTFAERIAIAEELSAAQIQHIMDYERAFDHYGVEERITVKCRGCGASMRTTVNIDAHSFLPS